MTREIKDFGEKIGGAKKDQWKERGFEISDLEGMTEREFAEYVKKTNVWAVPDFKKEVAEGMSPVVAYYIKKFRDMTPATPRPNAKRKEYVELFINTLNIYKSEINKIESEEDIIGLVGRIRERLSQEGVGIYREYSKPLKNLKYDEYDLNKLRFKTDLQNFPEEYTGTLSGVEVFGGEFSRGKSYIYNDNNDYYATKGRRIVVNDCKTKEELKEKLEVWCKKKKTAKKKAATKRFERPKVERLRPVGPDYRGGKDVIGEDYLETFKLRGGEFGNWNSQTERQEFLNLGYDAFKDLARALEIPDNLISLGGYEGQKLAIAFGARGSGRAKAHYEPTKVVINLTKKKGAGSLAHEWGHALDDFIGIKTKDVHMLSNKRLYKRPTDKYPKIIDAFRVVMDVITERPRTLEEVEIRREKEVKKFERDIGIRTNRLTGVYDATVEQAQKLALAREEFLKDPTEEGVDELSELVKEIGGRLPAKSHRDGMKDYIRYYKPEPKDEPKAQGTERSNYVTEAIRMDSGRSKGYYVKYEELFARAFESFVEDELEAQGIESNYLVYGTKNEMYKSLMLSPTDTEGVKPYPEGDERERINAAFRVLMLEVTREFGDEVTEDELAEKENEQKSKFMIVEFKNACKERDLDPDMGETQEKDGKYIIKLGKGVVGCVEVPKNTVGKTEAVLKLGDFTDEVYEYEKPEDAFYDYEALADYIKEVNEKVDEERAEYIDLPKLIADLQDLGLSYTGHSDRYEGEIKIELKNKGIEGLHLNKRIDTEGLYAIYREKQVAKFGKWLEGEYNQEKILKEIKENMKEDEPKEEEEEEKKEESKTRVEFNPTRIKQKLYGKVKLLDVTKTDEAIMLVFGNGVILKSMRYVQELEKGIYSFGDTKEEDIVIEDGNFNYTRIAEKVVRMADEQIDQAFEDAQNKPKGGFVESKKDGIADLRKAVQESGMRLTVINGDTGVFYYPAKKGEKVRIQKEGFPQRSIFSHAKTRYGHSKDSAEAIARREKGDLLEIKIDLRAIVFDKDTGLFATIVPLEYSDGIWVERGTVQKGVQKGEQGITAILREITGIPQGTKKTSSKELEKAIESRGLKVHYREIPREHRNGVTKSWAVTKGGAILIDPRVSEAIKVSSLIEAYVHVHLTTKGDTGAKRLMIREGVAYLIGQEHGQEMGKYCKSEAFKVLESKGEESIQNYTEQVVQEYRQIRI